MKFKKVEIQAFRAYNEVKDGTFDFTTKSAKIADFISIYAPNGFGKTSFYDAVEWGFTKNISRFLRHKTDKIKLAKAEDTNCILRNTFANKNTESIVRLYTSLQEQPFEQKIGKLKSNQRDFKFDEKTTIKGREFFQHVLLSQEYIDAFLKEDNANIRYTKFIKSFGDINLDNKYNIIIKLIEQNKDKEDKLDREVKELKSKINFDVDPIILSKINSEISQLNRRGEKIPLVQFDYKEKHIQQITDLIDGRIYDLKNDVSILQKKVDRIDSAVTGDNISSIDIELYFDCKAKRKQYSKELISLNKNKEQFNQLHEVERAQKNKNEELDKIAEAQSDFLELFNVYPEYQDVNKELIRINHLFDNTKDELKNVDFELKSLVDIHNKISAKLNLESLNCKKISSKLDAIPELTKLLKNKKEEQKDSTLVIDSLAKKDTQYEKNINIIEKEIEDWNEIKDKILAGNFQIPENEKTRLFYEIIKRLKSNVNLIEDSKRALGKIEKEIDDANKLNNDIEQLVSKGVNIVSDRKLPICPLCKHDYIKFEVLIQNISDNTFLSERMKKILSQKTNNEQNLEKLLKQQEEEKDVILITVNDSISRLIEDRAKEENGKKELVKQVEEVIFKKRKLETEINDLLNELGGEDIKVINKCLNLEHKKLQKRLKELNKDQQSNTVILNRLKERSIILEKKISNFKVSMNKLKKTDAYVRIISFLYKNQIEENNIDTELKNRHSSYKKNICRLTNEIKKCDELIFEYQKILEKNEEAVLISDIEQLEIAIEPLNKKVTSYEYFLKSVVKIDFSNMTKTELGKLFNDINSRHRKKIFKITNLIQLFEKTKMYKKSVLPFLKNEEFKRKEKAISEEKLFLTESVYPKLEKERQLLSEFIDKQIESFFHGKLINTLYQKLNPHPVYTEVKFKSDFSGDKPRLNVFVTRNNSDELIVPTLYYSTAQLNILSLSIFLAEALNTKDNNGKPVDCILIDDPIQSMDSVNILSTIDLLRSISVNMGKQIILSTHDENFHNLLQKKIPSDRFNAKYIELETFGKVKQQ